MFIDGPDDELVLQHLTREDNPAWWFGVGKMQGTLGLGDIVYSITWVTGVAWLVGRLAKVTGRSCGCASRRHRLNNIRLRLPFAYVRPRQ